MRIAAKKRMESPENLAKISASQSSGIKVEVTNLEINTLTTCHAIQAAARALGIDKRYIEHYIYLNKDKPVFGKYIFKLTNSEEKVNPFNASSVKVQKTSKKKKIRSY